MNEQLQLQSSIEEFFQLAVTGKWEEFDQRVLRVCDNEIYINWAKTEGFRDEREEVRDLAISIFQRTGSCKLDAQIKSGLDKILMNDPSFHLRRKAALALFRLGSREENVIDCLREAELNDEDPLVRKEAGQYLAQLTTNI